MDTDNQDAIDKILYFIADNLRFFHYNPRNILNYTLEHNKRLYALSMVDSFGVFRVIDIVLYKKRKTWYGRTYYDYCVEIPLERIMGCAYLKEACAKFRTQQETRRQQRTDTRINLGVTKFFTD